MPLSSLQSRILSHLKDNPADDLYRWGFYLRHSRIEAIAADLNEHADDVWYATKALRIRGHIDGKGKVIRDPKPHASGIYDVRSVMRGDAKPMDGL